MRGLFGGIAWGVIAWGVIACTGQSPYQGPAHQSATDQQRIRALQIQQAESDHAIAHAEYDVARLSASWADVVNRYRYAERQYARTRGLYEEAIAEADYATEDAETARDNWRRANVQWQLYRAIVIAAVAMEAGRHQGRSFSCDKVSTSAFRRLLIAQGRNLIGMDIDHIVPRSLGGADHPMNYQVLGSSQNRSLGARWDADKCLMAGRRRCGEALAVSKKCGDYSGPWF